VIAEAVETAVKPDLIEQAVEAARHSAVETSAAPAEQVVADEAPAQGEPVAVETAPLVPAAEAVETVAAEPPGRGRSRPGCSRSPDPVAEAAPVDLSAALGESGLVLIETRPGATQAVQPAAPAEPVQPRRRRAAVTVVDEPLVQVETGQK
jgi:hypothetical protein